MVYVKSQKTPLKTLVLNVVELSTLRSLSNATSQY